MNVVSSTHTLPMNAELLGALPLVGQPVTLGVRNFTVHSIEGDTWYAFDQDGQVTVDVHMTRRWLSGEPMALIIPEGSKVGDGLSQLVPVTAITPGRVVQEDTDPAYRAEDDDTEPTLGELLLVELGYDN